MTGVTIEKTFQSKSRFLNTRILKITKSDRRLRPQIARLQHKWRLKTGGSKVRRRANGKGRRSANDHVRLAQEHGAQGTRKQERKIVCKPRQRFFAVRWKHCDSYYIDAAVVLPPRQLPRLLAIGRMKLSVRIIGQARQDRDLMPRGDQAAAEFQNANAADLCFGRKILRKEEDAH